VLVPEPVEFCASAVLDADAGALVDAELPPLDADVEPPFEVGAEVAVVAASCALGDAVFVSCPTSCASDSMSPTMALNAVGLIPSISSAIWSNTPISCWLNPSAASALLSPCSAFELSEFVPFVEVGSLVAALVGAAVEVLEFEVEIALGDCVELVAPAFVLDESVPEFVDGAVPAAPLAPEDELGVDCVVPLVDSVCGDVDEPPVAPAAVDEAEDDDEEPAAACCPTTNEPENANIISLIETDSPLLSPP